VSLPSLRNTADLQSWANALVAELNRALEVLPRVHLQGQVLNLPVYQPADLPPPTVPGLVAAVWDGPHSPLMLISSDDNTWRRVGNLTVYP
jgi:hypothetical protein